MDINPDFKDLLSALNRARARYLVVGGYAMIFHGEPRATKDIDIWVDATAENAQRVWRALAEFGAPLSDYAIADFANENLFFKLGIEPNRIDILMGLDGATFAAAWERRVRATYGLEPIAVIGKQDLIRVKQAAGRPQDLLDVRRLQKSTPRARSSKKRK